MSEKMKLLNFFIENLHFEFEVALWELDPPDKFKIQMRHILNDHTIIIIITF